MLLIVTALVAEHLPEKGRIHGQSCLRTSSSAADMGSQYWLVSLPLEGGSADRTFSILQDKTTHGA